MNIVLPANTIQAILIVGALVGMTVSFEFLKYASDRDKRILTVLLSILYLACVSFVGLSILGAY